MEEQTIDTDRIVRPVYDLAPDEPIRMYEHGYDKPRHDIVDMHYVLELGITLKGMGHRFYRNFEADTEPGYVWLCGMWEPHGWSIKKVPCLNLLLMVRPEFLADLSYVEEPDFNWLSMFTVPPAKRPMIPKERSKEVLELAERMRHAAKTGEPQNALWLRTLFMELLLMLRRDWTPPRHATDGSLGSLHELNPAIALVFEKREFITEETAAAACGMGLKNFSRAFTRGMGIRFAQFALRHRLSQVAKRLTGSDEPIKAIAADWGFADLSHLYRQFKRAYGITPLKYRDQYRT